MTYKERAAILRKIERERGSRAILYATSDRPGMEAQVAKEIIRLFVDHLDAIEEAERISLVLHTAGGDALTAWSLVHLLRQFCRKLEVVVPYRAHSAGTLICLGAHDILMTKQATLSPIDPSINHPLNPPIPGGAQTAKMPVSVEALNGFTEFARESAGEGADLTPLAVELSKQIHPLVLGAAFRSRAQIRNLGERLLAPKMEDVAKRKKVLDFLCSESGSHDYTFDRTEGRESWGLPIGKPSKAFYKVIKSLHDSYSDEMQLSTRHEPVTLVPSVGDTKSYSCVRALIESVKGGSHRFLSEGTASRIQAPNGTEQVRDNRQFEGWRHEK